jgi:hypothetical protein
MIGCLLVLGAVPVNAQRFGGSQAPTHIPDLGGRSTIRQIMVEIEGEITTIAEAERGADDRRRPGLRALINYRIIAIELLEQGLGGGDSGSVAILAGLRMIYGRPAVDIGILRTDDGTTPRMLTKDEARLLVRFNDLAVERAEHIRTYDVDALDEHLPAILEPLWTFVAGPDPSAAVAYWPPGAGDVSGGEPIPDVDRIASLRARVAEAPLAPEAIAGLAELLDFLERGKRFREFRSAASAIERDVATVLELAAAFARPRGFDEATQAGCGERLASVVEDLRSPAARSDGRRALAHLVRLNGLMDDVAELRDAGADVDSLAPVIAGLCASDGGTGRGVSTCGGIVRRMAASRELDADETPAALRGARRRLHQAYEEAERAVLDALPALVAAERPGADPALASLLADQKQRLSDLQRLGRMRSWIDSIARIIPGQQRTFEGQIKRWSAALVDPQRRAAAVEALEDFERQHDRFAPVPFEHALRAGERAAVTATGGEHERLMALIDEERLLWARAWCRGERGGAAGRRLDLIAHLTERIGESADLITLGNEIVKLNRWGAWTTPETLLNRLSADLPGRLKLATAAVVSGRDNGVADQLELLEADAALARLAGACTRELLVSLEEAEGGPAATLGPLVAAPPADAWMAAERGRFASLCRLAIELEYATSLDRTADIRALRSAVDALATELTETMAAP